MNHPGFYRKVWWILTIILVATFIVAAGARYAELRETCNPDEEIEECGSFVLTTSQATKLSELGVSLDLYSTFQIVLDALPPIAYLAVGVLIVRRRPDDMTAVMMAFGLVAIGVVIIPETTSVLLRGSPAMAALFTLTWTVSMPAFVYVIATFPNGRFEPRWMILAAAVMTEGWGVERLLDDVLTRESLGVMYDVLQVTIAAGWIACLALLGGQIYRYRRRYSRAERQQIKWVLFGIAGILVGATIWVILFNGLGSRSETTQLFLYLVAFPLISVIALVLPATFALAIFRYHLYNIDVILNRTLVYTTLTIALGAMYILLVVGGGGLVRTLTSESTDIVIAASTLLIAAIFRPLRNRIQAFVDWRFYRRKYDARQTLESFRGTAREAVDLDQLTAELTGVISTTIQPAHVSIWLRAETAERDRI